MKKEKQQRTDGANRENNSHGVDLKSTLINEYIEWNVWSKHHN